MSKHTCFDEINAKLAPYNAQLASGFRITDDNSLKVTYYVQTEKLDREKRSKKSPVVLMSHCPFCGIELAKVDE